MSIGDADKSPRKRAKAPRNPALADLAAALSDALETRVTVDLGRSKGKITITFASVDDLERIVEVIAPRDGAGAARRLHDAAHLAAVAARLRARSARRVCAVVATTSATIDTTGYQPPPGGTWPRRCVGVAASCAQLTGVGICPTLGRRSVVGW